MQRRNRSGALKGGVATVLPLLRAINSAADVFPPLKSAVSIALWIGDTVVAFKSNKKDWANFDQHVQQSLGCVIQSIPNTRKPRDDLRNNLQKLADTLVKIQIDIKTLLSKQAFERFWLFTKDPEKINDMRKELNDAVGLFQLSSMITTGLDVAEILTCVKDKLGDRLVHTFVLNTLPYAEGASWDSSRACLPHTRVDLLADIWAWATTIHKSDNAQMFWLADVAGAGKSSIAHTFAQRCREHGILASSFFFDRETAGRNGPQKLFSTIARDLASISEDIAEQIGQAIDRDPSLATAPISRQFEDLIENPSKILTVSRPVVIVVDALDEGYNHNIDLLTILGDKIPQLPPNFRIFMTSRAEEDIEQFLHSKSHIERRSMNIQEQPNKNDVAIYIQHRLKEIATRRKLGPHWPNQKCVNAFIKKAEGLMIWAATVCDFLAVQLDPSKHLNALLTARSQLGLRAEVKMDKLYSDILSTCNWDDDDFVQGYDVLVGAIMAAKIPLSASALQHLRDTSLAVGVIDILRPLGSLLTGLSEENEPIRILHLSFRDFLTVRAQSSRCSRYYINEKEHSQKLALACISIMNDNLKRDICGIGDVSIQISEIEGIKDIVQMCISEELAYACIFWTDHIVDVDGVSLPILDALRDLLSKKLLHWIEVMSLKNGIQDATQSLEKLKSWLKKQIPLETDLFDLASDAIHVVNEFSAVILNNPLHVYASALPFMPINTTLCKAYMPLYPDVPRVTMGLHSEWSSTISSFGGPSDRYGVGATRSISFSTDGSRIAIGSDNIVWLWLHRRGTHTELRHHTSMVTSVTFSNDGSMIASSSYDGSVCIWDATMSKTSLLCQLRPSEDAGLLLTVSFSPDSTQLVAGSNTGSLHIWNVANDSVPEQKLLQHMSWITSVVFLQDGPQMISCSGDGMVCVWNTHTWQFILQPLDRHLYGVNSITISPCGSRLGICFADESLRVESFDNPVLHQPSSLDSECMTIIFSPHTPKFLSYSTKGSPHIYNSLTNSLISVIGEGIGTVFTTAVFSPVFSFDNTWIAARCHGGTICLCDISTETVTLRSIATNMGNSGPVVFSEDGSRIAFCSSNGKLHIWEFKNESLHSPSLDATDCEPLALSFSPNMSYVAGSCTDGYLRIWSTNSGLAVSLPFQDCGQWVNCMKFSPDSTTIAIGSADGMTCMIDCTNGKLVGDNRLGTHVKTAVIRVVFEEEHVLRTSCIGGHEGGWNFQSGAYEYSTVNKVFYGTISASFSHNGSLIATSSATGQVHIWNRVLGNPVSPLRVQEGYKAYTCVAFSPNASQISAGTYEGVVRVWEIPEISISAPAEDGDRIVYDVRVSYDGLRVALLRDHLSLCDARTGANIEPVTSELFYSGQFSPDGTLITGIASPTGLRIVLDARTGVEISRFPSDRDGLRVAQLVFSPDNKYILTVNSNDEIRLWNVIFGSQEGQYIGRASSARMNDEAKAVAKEKEKEVTTFYIPEVQFTLDSSAIVDKASSGETVRIWDLNGTLRFNKPCGYPVALVSDGSRLVHGLSGMLQVLDTFTDTVVYETQEAWVTCIAISPNGSLIAGAENVIYYREDAVRLWNLDAGSSVWRTLRHDMRLCLGRDCIVFTSDSSKVAACGDSGDFYIWHINGDLIAKGHYPLHDEPTRYLEHFVHWYSKTDHSDEERLALIPMDDEGWIRTRDLRRYLWVPFDYRGDCYTSKGTAVIRTLDWRVVVIRTGDVQAPILPTP